MKKFTRILAIVVLYAIGTSAIIGGWALMSDPSGKEIGLPFVILPNTPFLNFFYPGLILALVNGLGSLITGSMAILKSKFYQLLIVIQGFILVSWIMVEIALLNDIYLVHSLFGSLGILIITAGILLHEWQYLDIASKKRFA